MQMLFLDPIATFFLNVIAWLLFDVGIGLGSSKLLMKHFDPEQRFYRSFPWEKEGRIYQQLFKVRSWKRFLPQGSRIYQGFSLQHLISCDPRYLEQWLEESARGEFCHWMMIIPGVFFFLWNSPAMGWGMVGFALVFNFFPIVAQRFNRPRVRRLLGQARKAPGVFESSYALARRDLAQMGSGFPANNPAGVI